MRCVELSNAIGGWHGVFCAAAMLAAFAAPAQESTEDSRQLAPGLTVTGFIRAAPTGAQGGRVIAFDSRRASGARPVLAVPAGAPWAEETLSSLLGSAGAASGMAAVLPPEFGTSPYPWGLWWGEGRLYSWPPRGPLFVVTTDGQFELLELDAAAPGTARFSGGWELAIDSVNGPPPEPAGRGVLYSGSYSGRSQAGTEWSTEARALILRPAENEAAAIDLTLGRAASRDEGSRWQVEQNVGLRALILGPGELALALVPDGSGPSPGSLVGQEITLRLPVDDLVRSSLLAISAGEWLWRAGASVARTTDERRTRSIIAVDETGGRCWIATLGAQSSAIAPPSNADIDGLLAEWGAAHAVELRHYADAMMTPLDAPAQITGLGAGTVRALLAAKVALPTLQGEEGETLMPLEIMLIDAPNSAAPWNGPETLMHTARGPSPRLDTFWAHSVTPAEWDEHRAGRLRESPSWIEFRFPEPVPVATVELFHAETVGFSPEFNLRAFRILGKARWIDPWEEIAAINHPRPVARERITLPGNPVMEYVRLEITEPNFLPAGTAARLGAIRFWGPEGTGQ